MRGWLLPFGVGLTLCGLSAADQPVAGTPAAPAALPGSGLTLDGGGRSLFDLIQEGRRDDILDFIEAHPESLRERLPNLQYPLHAAIGRDHLEIAALLVEHGADVNSVDARNQSPLLLAAIKNNLALAQIFLAKEPKVDQQDVTGQTALHYAVRADNRELVAGLLALHASVDLTEPSKGYSPVHLAIALGNDALAQVLVESQLPLKGNELFAMIRENQMEGFTTFLAANPKMLDVRIAGGWSLLHQAVQDKRADFIREILDLGFDSLARDCGRRTALHIAALSGDLDLITRLIQSKADLNVIDERGLAPLSLAVRSNNLAIAQLLVGNGADTNILDAAGRTPAFEMDRCEDAMAALLLQHEVHLNVRDPLGRTVLYSALSNPKRTALLLANGAATNVKDKNGLSLLHEAAIKASGDVVRQLVRAGVPLEELDAKKATALHIAAKNGNTAAAQALVEAGCNLNPLDKTGSTPLHYAVYSLPLTHLLLQRHAVIDVVDARDRWTPLDIATRSGDPDATALLQAHADVLAAAAKGDLPAVQTVYAAMAARKASAEKDSKPDVARIFAAAPASLNEARDRDGRTPLLQAAANGHKAFAAALIPAGVDPEARDGSGASALMLAAQNNHGGVMQVLLQKRAEVNAIDLKRRTALHRAAAAGHVEAVQLLLATAIDRAFKDADGKSASDLATANKHPEIAALIEGLATPPPKSK